MEVTVTGQTKKKVASITESVLNAMRDAYGLELPVKDIKVDELGRVTIKFQEPVVDMLFGVALEAVFCNDMVKGVDGYSVLDYKEDEVTLEYM